MKRTLSVLMLCSLLVMITAGTTLVYGQADSRYSYPTQETPVIDGTWTTTTEWIDGMQTNATDSLVFRTTFDTSDGYTTVNTRILVEILDDTTDDDGDYMIMCIDGDRDNGTAPQTGDFRIDIEGDGTLTVYEGNGSGWDVATPDVGAINFSSDFDTSPASATSHRIIELEIEKTATVPHMEATWKFRMAVYDDSNSGAGEQVWPVGSDQDVPDEWGTENFDTNPIPEGFTFAVMAVLTSISLIAGSQYLRKRSKK